MSITKRWTVEIQITEADRETNAEARLNISDVEKLEGGGVRRA
ncbi:dsRBD fold-containing protein [Kribbella catacumbae]|nr:dsRBD fold-containing protein [Kribbella catacumbae]